MLHNTIEIRVRYGETDAMGVVYYGNYALFLEQGRTEWLRDLGYTYKGLEDAGIMLPVVNLNIDYKHSARYDELIRVTTRLKEKPTAKITFLYEVHNQEGRLLCNAETTLVFIDKNTSKIRRAPDYLIEKIIELI
ncbi:MAG TPA: thioesterase family protein [Flavobacteriaceae bacterium]|nr:thioesterase family protein [Flavobacteriaceae bacterium]